MQLQAGGIVRYKSNETSYCQKHNYALEVRRQLFDTIFKLGYLNDYKAEDVLLTPDNQRFPWQTSQKCSWKKIVSTTIEQYFIIEDNFYNRKIKWYFKNHIMKFIKMVWSLHCLRLLNPDYNYFLAAKIVQLSSQQSARLLPGPGSESSQGDDQRVPQPLVLAALQPPDDPPEPAVLGGGEDQHPRV